MVVLPVSFLLVVPQLGAPSFKEERNQLTCNGANSPSLSMSLSASGCCFVTTKGFLFVPPCTMRCVTYLIWSFCTPPEPER